MKPIGFVVIFVVSYEGSPLILYSDSNNNEESSALFRNSDKYIQQLSVCVYLFTVGFAPGA